MYIVAICCLWILVWGWKGTDNTILLYKIESGTNCISWENLNAQKKITEKLNLFGNKVERS